MFRKTILWESLFIDRLQKKWVARSLFFLVFLILAASNLWPIGDPDLNKINSFVEQYNAIVLDTINTTTADASVSTTADSLTPNASAMAALMQAIPPIPWGNIIYIFFEIGIFFLCLFLAIFYSRLYVSGQKSEKLSLGVASYFRKLPHIILFFAILAVLTLILSIFLLSSIFSYFFMGAMIYLILSLFFVPILLMAENKSLSDAVVYSFKYSKGVKFVMFWNIMSLYLLYWLFTQPITLFLSEKPKGMNFLVAFFSAYLVLALGRMLGILYDRICLHPAPAKEHNLTNL